MRLKDEGPGLGLQRDLTLPRADFFSLAAEKKIKSVINKAAHQLNYNNLLHTLLIHAILQIYCAYRVINESEILRRTWAE